MGDHISIPFGYLLSFITISKGSTFVFNTKNKSGNTTLAKKGLAQRNRPKAVKTMATEVQRVRLWILLRKGSAKMKQIWLISFPENTQAVS